MKALKILQTFWLQVLIFALLFHQCQTSSGTKEAIYTVGFIIYSELLCLHIDLRAYKNAKES